MESGCGHGEVANNGYSLADKLIVDSRWRKTKTAADGTTASTLKFNQFRYQ